MVTPVTARSERTEADMVITKTVTLMRGLGVHGATPPAQGAASADLTDNTGAVADATIENIPQLANSPAVLADAAQRAEVNTVLTAIENDLADLTAKVNDCLTALRNAGFIAT